MNLKEVKRWIAKHPPTLETRGGQLGLRIHGDGPTGDDIPPEVIRYLEEHLGIYNGRRVPPKRKR